MNIKNKIIRIIGLILLTNIFSGMLFAQDGNQEFRSEHFIINYSLGVDESFVKEVADTSERFYSQITEEFNLVRNQLWLWDNRAKISIAKDKDDYVKRFPCGAWSAACVDYTNKMIYTYPGQSNFNSIFIHELTHIIFREYIGMMKLPLWIDEGVALYMEDKYRNGFYQNSLYHITAAVKNDKYIKFSDLDKINLLALNSQSKEQIQQFYIQSFSIINFLIKRYGRDTFAQFLFFMKSSFDYQQVLPKVFSITNREELEQLWQKFYQE